MSKFVAYFRTSTSRQSLSFDAQRSAVSAYVGCNELMAEFNEIETGKNNERPELKKAIALARKTKSTLIIAKLDRLSRNLAFIANLLDGDIDFVCADMPTANKMVLQMMAVVAEHEAKQISDRTKAALKVAKERGKELGNRTNWNEAQGLGHQTNIKLADNFAAKVLPLIRDIAKNDASSLHRVADTMNLRGIQTRRSGTWTGSSILHIIRRSGYSNLRELVATSA